MTTDVDAVEVAADGTTYRLVLPDRESDYIQGWVSEHGRPYEHPMLADMARRLHAGDVVLDVGANVGNHSIYLAAVVGCHVEAFEPDATLTSALGASVEANGLGAVVRVHTVALGSGAGTGALVRPDVTNIGAQQIRLGEGDIRVVPLDAVDVRRPVRGMKVDVEGMELAVLQGAAVLIEQDRPLLYVECATEIAFGAVASWLDERGYSYWETFNATPTHLFVPTETLTADQVSRRLLLKTVRDGYRSTEAFNGLRGRLEQANLKYRASTEAHRVLKHELDEVRSEQARAEESAAAELSHAQGERERLESERAGLERHAHELLAAVEALQSDLDRMRIELADARQTAAFAEGERDAARGRAAEAHRDRDDLAVELRALREEADRLRVEVAARTEDLGGARAGLRQRDAQLQEAQRHAAEVTERVRAVEAERDEAWSFAGEVEEARDAVAEELRSLQEHTEQLERALEELRTELTDASAELTGAWTTARAYEGEVLDLTHRMALRTEEVAKAHEQLAATTEHLRAAESDRDAARDQLARQSADRAERSGELRAIRAELAAARAEVVDVTVRLRSQEARTAELTQSADAAWAETGELTAILARHRAEAASAAAELRAAVDALRAERDALRTAAAEATAREHAARAAEDAALAREEAAVVAERAARAAEGAARSAETAARRGEQGALEREAEALTRLRELRDSATYRAGKEISRASTSASAALALPARLWSIAREPRPAHRVIEAGPVTATPAIGPSPARPGITPATEPTTRAVPDPAAPVEVKPAGPDAPAAVPTPVPDRADAVLAAPTAPALAAAATATTAPEATAVDARRGPASSGTRLRVAAIVDEFTALSLGPDCDLHQLTPADWEVELEATQPQLLFVESAWRGKDGLWHNTVGQFPAELKGIVDWCTARGVPTAFWNKEDPVHFATFLTTARAFDHVFTTDIDCIGRYKAALGHDRVYLLPFACQPRVHNPLEAYARKDAFAFAGSYYRRYPERTRDLDSFLEHLPEFRPVEIFDRNAGSDHPDYSFPEAYRRYVVGTLPPEEIDRAYKGYRFGINLNSVKQSQTMFARRVYELLASNTVTVSNFSRGTRLLFGDLVISTDSGADAVRRLRELAEDDDRLDRLRLAALRSVMSQHTYADRLAYVLAKATGGTVPEPLPLVALVGHARTDAEAEVLLGHLRRQQGVRVRGILLVDDGVERRVEPGVTTLRADVVRDRTIVDAVGDAGLVGVLHPDDHYGPHYALDLALATRYSDADVIGKRCRYRAGGAEGVALTVLDAGAEYRRAGRLPVRASVARTAALADVTLGRLVASADDGVHDAGLDQIAVDRFSYCQDGARLPEAASAVDDLDVRSGTPLAELQAAGEAAEPNVAPGEGMPAVSAAQLGQWFDGRTRPMIDHTIDEDGWDLGSTLADGEHDYLYAGSPVPVGRLWDGDVAQAYVDSTPGLRLQFVFIFLDSDGQRLGNFFALAQQNAEMVIPEGSVSARIGVRLLGPGRAVIRRIVLGRVSTETESLVATSRDLVVTNHYPSYDDLYRNGFIHSRLKRYRERGVSPEVFRLRRRQALTFDEFEGVDVVTGSDTALQKMLTRNRYRSVLVHFLDEDMWSALLELDRSLRLVVWIHGADVQPWWRRRFNYGTAEQLAAAEIASDERMAFWRRVFSEAPDNVHFVFVSRYLADTAMADLGVELPAGQVSVVHNPIDVDLYDYVPKEPEQRLRVLSIRPYASLTYANDLTVAAIQRLSDEPWFGELEFRLIGDGPLFDETVAPLRQMPNVTLEKRFVPQREIASLHKEYGVFLVPTRMDTQGVSRDEAMSSGLVPISSAVAAVPDFVDDRSGILTPADDAEALARAVATLREDPELFVSLSAGAAARVRRQAGSPTVIDQELGLFVPRSEDDS